MYAMPERVARRTYILLVVLLNRSRTLHDARDATTAAAKHKMHYALLPRAHMFLNE